jgi:hypothetical protein
LAAARRNEIAASTIRDHHRRMKEKYLAAASRPWKKLDPDPPEPDESAEP